MYMYILHVRTCTMYINPGGASSYIHTCRYMYTHVSYLPQCIYQGLVLHHLLVIFVFVCPTLPFWWRESYLLLGGCLLYTVCLLSLSLLPSSITQVIQVDRFIRKHGLLLKTEEVIEIIHKQWTVKPVHTKCLPEPQAQPQAGPAQPSPEGPISPTSGGLAVEGVCADVETHRPHTPLVWSPMASGGVSWSPMASGGVFCAQPTANNEVVSAQSTSEAVSSQTAGESVSSQSAGESVLSQSAGKSVSSQSAVESVSSQSTGESVSSQSAGESVPSQSTGESVLSQSTGESFLSSQSTTTNGMASWTEGTDLSQLTDGTDLTTNTVASSQPTSEMVSSQCTNEGVSTNIGTVLSESTTGMVSSYPINANEVALSQSTGGLYICRPSHRQPPHTGIIICKIIISSCAFEYIVC